MTEDAHARAQLLVIPFQFNLQLMDEGDKTLLDRCGIRAPLAQAVAGIIHEKVSESRLPPKCLGGVIERQRAVAAAHQPKKLRRLGWIFARWQIERNLPP